VESRKLMSPSILMPSPFLTSLLRTRGLELLQRRVSFLLAGRCLIFVSLLSFVVSDLSSSSYRLLILIFSSLFSPLFRSLSRTITGVSPKVISKEWYWMLKDTRSRTKQPAAARIAAKFELESYRYDLRNSINKLASYNREVLRTAIESTTSWLDDNQEAK